MPNEATYLVAIIEDDPQHLARLINKLGALETLVRVIAAAPYDADMTQVLAWRNKLGLPLPDAIIVDGRSESRFCGANIENGHDFCYWSASNRNSVVDYSGHLIFASASATANHRMLACAADAGFAPDKLHCVFPDAPTDPSQFKELKKGEAVNVLCQIFGIK